ncbi:MAG: long-chain fatty acid--CoA ligase [Desulfobacteraceae bacterium]|jgi:acyl-coenzyme A synthetase/AMP-(fatty) acid ligase
MDTAASEHRFALEAQQLVVSLTSGKNFVHHPFLTQGLTFAQLHGMAAAIRERTSKTLMQSRPLCLCSDNRAHMAAALLASLGGGPPLLIPHAYGPEILEEACVTTPYTHGLVEGDCNLPAGVSQVALPGLDQAHNHRRPRAECLPLDDTWLYLFTGGSTGTPRVWSKSPRNLLAESLNIAKTFGITDKDTILSTVPANHIYGLLYSVLLPLVTGARVSLRTPSFPNEIVQCLQETKATVLVSIPAHYRALKQHPIGRHQVRIAYSSAGALAEKDGIEFSNNTGIPITEIYGSTETGGIAQRNRAAGQTALHPFGCVEVKIEKTHLQVRSDFLSRELEKNGAGFFQTADRAQWASPSGFTLLGRSDGIVKVGGKRVDLAGTREALLQVEGAKDAYVFARPVHSGRENEIIALVEGNTTADQLHMAAQRHLPPHARPRTIKTTRRIPLSSTGKYNRTAIERIFDSGL